MRFLVYHILDWLSSAEDVDCVAGFAWEVSAILRPVNFPAIRPNVFLPNLALSKICNHPGLFEKKRRKILIIF